MLLRRFAALDSELTTSRRPSSAKRVPVRARNASIDSGTGARSSTLVEVKDASYDDAVKLSSSPFEGRPFLCVADGPVFSIRARSDRLPPGDLPADSGGASVLGWKMARPGVDGCLVGEAERERDLDRLRDRGVIAARGAVVSAGSACDLVLAGDLAAKEEGGGYLTGEAERGFGLFGGGALFSSSLPRLGVVATFGGATERRRGDR